MPKTQVYCGKPLPFAVIVSTVLGKADHLLTNRNGVNSPCRKFVQKIGRHTPPGSKLNVEMMAGACCTSVPGANDLAAPISTVSKYLSIYGIYKEASGRD
jgi:hypothetical protein